MAESIFAKPPTPAMTRVLNFMRAGGAVFEYTWSGIMLSGDGPRPGKVSTATMDALYRRGLVERQHTGRGYQYTLAPPADHHAAPAADGEG